MQTRRLIHGHLAWSLERRGQSAQLWLGRRGKIVDGTTRRVPAYWVTESSARGIWSTTRLLIVAGLVQNHCRKVI